MSQNPGCCCSDGYSLLTANTGIASISHANPNLDGTGNTSSVITGASNGTTVKSVIIKAYMPVTSGIVRLFIGSGETLILYKEVPVPTTPALNATPTPLPMLQTFDIKLDGGLKLASGTSLFASTQNAESFNVIAEGVDWAYPETTPAVCCNFKQETAVTGRNSVSTANTSLSGSGTIATVFSAPASGSNGSVIKAITIKALQTTNEGMVRIFISPDGSTWSLMKEVYIPQTQQSGQQPSFKVVLDECFNLKAGYSIGASTQIAQSFGITIEGTAWQYA